LSRPDLDDWRKIGIDGMSLLDPDLGEVGKVAQFSEIHGQVAWVESIWACLDLDTCRAEEEHDVRSHVDPPDDVVAALDLEEVETSEPVELLIGVAAARKGGNCSEGLFLTAP
jgi:hypothetical protein